jgi:hypothetical protein
MVQPAQSLQPTIVGWRLKLGAAIFALSILAPVAGLPFVASLGLSAATTATSSGAILAIAEVLGLAAVATMGKSGFAFLKSRIGAFLRQYGPPRTVSRARYRTGLILIVIPALFGWLTPYLATALPELRVGHLAFAVAGDVMLIIGLFVAGGDFWDKLRALLVHDARATFP